MIQNKLLLRLILKKTIINAVEWFKKIKLSWYFVLQFWHHLPRPQFIHDLEGVIETLPEAQRTQGIESLTWIILLTKLNLYPF